MKNNIFFEIDGVLLKKMLKKGAENLQKNVEKINALNVFPVPDGDTGTNMNLTFSSGMKEIESTNSDHLTDIVKALSKGLLMGARGNSGVILSQIFRGFSKYVEGKEVLNPYDFSYAFQTGVDMAYKAIMKPVEGTILTVSKDAAAVAIENSGEINIVVLMERIVNEAKASLKRTKEILPILKQVGVVDSGGQGLVVIYEGMLSVLKGEEIEEVNAGDETYRVSEDKQEHVDDEIAEMMSQGILSVDDIEFGYCTEFMVLRKYSKKNYNEHIFREKLSQLGDSILVISDDEIIKVHIHAEKIYEVLKLAQQYGELTKIKIENMREQFRTRSQSVSKERKEYGIIAVGVGEGIKEMFASLGTDYFITGGQTMNPSTEDITQAIKKVNADKVILLPNNSNIIMAAEQAAELSEEKVYVVPSKSIQQGLSALIGFNLEDELNSNLERMKENLNIVKSGQITRSVRDTEINNMKIQKDNYMGILDGKILATDSELPTTINLLFEMILDDDSEIVTVIYGEEVTKEEAEQLGKELEEKYEDIEVQVIYGGQPLYPYLISVE